MTLDKVLLEAPRRGVSLMSEVPLYALSGEHLSRLTAAGPAPY